MKIYCFSYLNLSIISSIIILKYFAMNLKQKWYKSPNFSSSIKVVVLFLRSQNHLCVQKTFGETNVSIYFNTDRTKVMDEKLFYLFSHIFYDMTAYDSSDMLNLLNLTEKDQWYLLNNFWAFRWSLVEAALNRK